MKTPRDLQKLFTEVRKGINQSRRDAQRTLSPHDIRKSIKAGTSPADLELLIGTKADGSNFTVDDLKQFEKNRLATSKRFGKTKGVTVDQLIAASRPADIKRANGTFTPVSTNGWRGNLVRGAARLYQVRFNMLFFSVRASSESRKDLHQVKIRLEEWDDQLTNSRANKSTATKNALNGKVSIDCDCERHQYWYRYLAGIGGYAIAPPTEKDFPKVRNPGLAGSCCKHVVAAFQVLRTPTYQAIIAGHLDKQRSKSGFGDDKSSRMLTKKELDKIKRSRPRQTNQKKALERAKLAVRRLMKDQTKRESLRRQVQSLKARTRKAEAEVKRQKAKVEQMEKAQAKAAASAVKNTQAAVNSMIETVMQSQGVTEKQARDMLAAMIQNTGAGNASKTD